VDGVVAVSADYQGFAAARGHPLHPGGFLLPAWFVHISELADVMHLDVVG
jgi:hypothetical protein